MDLIKGKKIVGTWGGETDTDIDIPEYVRRYLCGKLKLSELIRDEYRLKDINMAFDDFLKGKVGRALLNLKS